MIDLLGQSSYKKALEHKHSSIKEVLILRKKNEKKFNQPYLHNNTAETTHDAKIESYDRLEKSI